MPAACPARPALHVRVNFKGSCVVSSLRDIHGEPVIQVDPEPAPGFYVSTTSLENFAFPETRQGRYIDASTIPFVVLPFGLGMGLKLGDLCFVYNKATGKSALAIYADAGPRGQNFGSLIYLSPSAISCSLVSDGTKLPFERYRTL